MPIGFINDIIDQKPQGRLLGIDQGEKRIGLAICDPMQSIATPLEVLPKTKFSKYVLRLADIWKEYDMKGMVIGYPYNMDGSEGPRCESVKHFAQNIYGRKDLFGEDIWILLHDERLSTSHMQDFLIEQDVTRKRRGEVIDKMAAQYILQDALERF